MHPLVKVAVGVLAAVGAFYVGFLIFITVTEPCVHYGVAELRSPDQQHIAGIELQSCEDGTSSELWVWVWRSDDPNKRSGGPFSSDPTTTEVYLEWRSANQLVVRYPSAMEINDRLYLGDVDLYFEEIAGLVE